MHSSDYFGREIIKTIASDTDDLTPIFSKQISPSEILRFINFDQWKYEKIKMIMYLKCFDETWSKTFSAISMTSLATSNMVKFRGLD